MVQVDIESELSPLTADLSNINVDPSSLVTSKAQNLYPVGMENFRSKNSKSSPKTEINTSQTIEVSGSSPAARLRWKTAAMKIKLIKDPWHEFHIEKYPVETVIRHRYNPVKKAWSKDQCVVKMETKQFANGAMRACFRL
jgi:hypothetical protein